MIQSDFECVINAITKQHTFVAGGCYIDCKNKKYSKDIQTFYNLEEYTKALHNQLNYIEEIEEIIIIKVNIFQ